MPFDYSNIAKQYKAMGPAGRAGAASGPGPSPVPAGGSATSAPPAPATGGGSVLTNPNKTTAGKVIGKSVGGVFSFLGDVTKAIVKPLASTVVQFPRAFVSGVAGIAGREDVRTEWSKPVNVPGLEEVKGLSAVPGDAQRYGTQTPGQTAGQALEIASSAVGGSSAASAVTRAGSVPVRALAKQGAKEGLKAGFLGGAGAELQDPEAGLGDTIAGGLKGAAIGGALGFAVPIVAAKGKSIWRSMFDSTPAKAAGAADDVARAADSAIPGGPVTPDAAPPAPGMTPVPKPTAASISVASPEDAAEQIGRAADEAAGVRPPPGQAPTPGATRVVPPSEVPPGLYPGADRASTTPKGRILNPSKNPIPLEEPLKKEAISAGIDERVIDLIDGASYADRVKMQRQMAQAYKKSKSYMTERPVSIAGESVMERVNHVSEARKQVGKEYGELVKRLPNQPVDVSAVKKGFLDALEEDGVVLKGGVDEAPKAAVGGKVAKPEKVKLDFSKTRYRNDKGAQKLISQLYDDLSADRLTPKEIVTTRQRIFDDLDLGSKQQALSDRTSSVIKRVRDELDEPLRAMSPAYAEKSKLYAQTMEALKDFYKLMGKSFQDGEESVMNLRAGEVGSRLGGNASANPIMVLDQLEQAALATGMEVDDDLARQFFFADILDDAYGITQPKSLRGDVTRAGEQAMENVGLAADFARGKALSVTGKLYQRAMGQTKEDQIELLKKLLGMPYKQRGIIEKLAGE